ncbi:MAG: hypothetical protein IT445_15705 [Phycisphaeraceae bacterium]|nr:hypothetical protein [Phycisphaeraceae bacterium]
MVRIMVRLSLSAESRPTMKRQPQGEDVPTAIKASTAIISVFAENRVIAAYGLGCRINAVELPGEPRPPEYAAVRDWINVFTLAKAPAGVDF